MAHTQIAADTSFSAEASNGFIWAGEAGFTHEVSLLAASSFLALPFAVASWLARTATSSIPKASNNDNVPNPRQWSKARGDLAALLFAFACELPVLLSTPREGLADLVKGRDPLLDEILARVPAIRRGPSSPWLFRNRHVQFLPFLIQNELHRAQGIPYQRVDVDLSDCADKTNGCRGPEMNVTVTLDIFPPLDAEDGGFDRGSPVILFAPGLRCHSQDLPGNSMIRKAFGSGFRSIVVNRRGHTPGQPLKSPRWNLFGDVDDMEKVYWFVKENLVTLDTAFFLHGISSGTAVTVAGLSKWDRRRAEGTGRDAPAFVASVAVAPGYDTSRVLRRDRFLWPYNDILTQAVKDHFVVQNEALLRSHDDDAVERMLGASSLQEFVDAGVAFAGYDNATLYYRDTNPINEVSDVTTPKLVLNAIDDPCFAISNLYERSPYPQHKGKTFAQMIRETERGLVAVTYTGSHCPFLCTRDRWLPLAHDPLTGGWMLNSWADQVAIEYYRAALDVYGSRRFL